MLEVESVPPTEASEPVTTLHLVEETPASDAADAGSKPASIAKDDAPELSPYESYKKSNAGKHHKTVSKKAVYQDVDMSNMTKAADVLRRLNERRDERTYQKNEFTSLKDDLKRKDERVHDIHDVMVGKSGAVHRTPLSSLRDKYGFKYDINQAESNLRVAPEYQHPQFWKSFPLASVPVEVDPLYYPYYYEPYYLRYKPERLRRRYNYKDYGQELHNQVLDTTMEVERLSNLVDSIDKEQASTDTSHCAPCCDANGDLEFLALMAHHRSHSVPHYPLSRYYARASLRHSTTPSIITASTYPRLPVSVPRSSSVGPSASATIRRNRIRRSVSPSLLPTAAAAATTMTTTKSGKSSRFLGEGLERNRNKSTRRGTSPGYSIPVSLMVPKLRKVLGSNMTTAVVNDDDAVAAAKPTAASEASSASQTVAASESAASSASAAAVSSKSTASAASMQEVDATPTKVDEEEEEEGEEEEEATETVAKAVSEAVLEAAVQQQQQQQQQQQETKDESAFASDYVYNSASIEAALVASLPSKGEEEEEEFVKRESVNEAFSMTLPALSSSNSTEKTQTQVVFINEPDDDDEEDEAGDTKVSASTIQLSPATDSGSKTMTTTTTMETSTVELGSTEPVVRRQQVTIVEDRYSSSDLSSSDVDEDEREAAKTTPTKQNKKASSSSSSSSSSSEGEEEGGSKARKGILKKE